MSDFTPRNQLSDPLTEAMAALAYAHPFFAAYMYDRTKVWCLWEGDPLCAQIPTAATDGRNIWFNAAFMEKLDLSQRMFVIAHEVSHDLLGHSGRMRRWTDLNCMPTEDGSRDLPYVQQVMNIAMDAEINATLVACGLKRPKDTILFDWVRPNEWTVEGIYEKLYDENGGDGKGQAAGGSGTPQDGQDGDPGSGDGEVEDEGPGGLTGDPMPSHGGFDQHIVPKEAPSAMDDEARKQAITSAISAAKGIGKMPAHLQQQLDRLLDPLVDWRDELRELVVKTVGQDNYDWRRFSKRRFMMLGTIEPRRQSERCGNLVFIFDTSGSVNEYIVQFQSEIAAVVDELAPSAVHVVWTDTRVQHVDTLEDAERADVGKLTTHYGGGTDLRVGFDWVEQELLSAGEEIAAIVVLTDSATPWPDSDPGYPVICATTNVGGEPDWMRTVAIPEKQARRAA